MPGKSRFSGGSLLGPVSPLPDDDEPAEQKPAPAVEAPPPLASVPEPELAPAAVDVEESPPLPPDVATPAGETLRGRAGPPSTLRINEAAGSALWAAYLEAKTADPFLSFRQFTSAVVLDGLLRAEQRAKRRR